MKRTDMPTIKLFGHTYALPAVANGRFRRLQQRVTTQSRLIQKGNRLRPHWFELGQYSSQPPSPAKRFQDLSRLIQNYHAIIDELRDSKNTYQFFFAQLAAGVQQALDEKRREMRAIEQERLASYQEAVARQDNALKQLALEDEERLVQGVRLLGQAALLLLKKIALCQEGIARLAEDQELQKQVLTQMIERLESHRRAYERRQRIDKVVREVAEMAKVALDFEDYMREHLGPLQDLLDKVIEVDTALHGAVTEIEEISHRMLQSDILVFSAREASARMPPLTPLDQRVLDRLIAFRLQKEGLAAVWKRLEQQDGSAEALDMDIALTSGTKTTQPILTALDNIQMLVDMRLTPLIAGHTSALQSPLLPLEHELVTRARRERVSRSGVWRKMLTMASQLSANRMSASVELGLEFVLIEAGTFSMGSTVFTDEQPVHGVRISQPFYLGKYPVTQGQWQAVMGENPSHFLGDPNRPVENVSWEEIQAFITKLNEREGSMKYRLPTEAEWEYAARADSTDDYSFGKEPRQLSNYGWHAFNSGGKTHPVRQLKPNAWGLYDMHGNVWEWVLDWYHEAYYEESSSHDPHGPASGSYRVVRGGSWDCTAEDCRSASRNVEHPSTGGKYVGFRLLRKVSATM